MKLISPAGQPKYGVISEAVSEVNYRDFDLRDAMDRRRGALAKRLGFNQFTFLGLHGRDVVGGVAIVDLKLVSSAFCYLYDFRRQLLLESSWLRPLSAGTRIDTTPDAGHARFKGAGVDIDIASQSSGRLIRLDAANDQVHWNLQLQAQPNFSPLRVCSRAGYEGWVFTQKAAGLTLSGSVRWGGAEFHFDPRIDRGSVDWSCGYMRKDTFWNWACFSGQSIDGRDVGLNLAAGVNETGVTENAVWVDGELIKLGLAEFHFDRYDESAPWHLTTSDGKVELTFERAGTRRERLNVGLIASNFRQHCGRFYGRVEDARGRWLAIEGVTGFVEDHYARW